ncbi:biphenyl 2,3-dioxygenase [Diaphorobacter sp. HDW4A]|uniref:VOC family protein n=1 Tax=Diaphorobacter sp. HDW4A TaxID=2714924 RepID=UPI001409E158|nr:VOC family protein [Diaphorobacter sp. HDW4A]QIL80353.1 biphenyl 2,3-dioxygenase [Diaphorobacter sp. HDW4A]
MMEIRGLAYIVAESTNLDQWSTYAKDVLGMMATPVGDGTLHIKMDERQFRFQVQAGSKDRYHASGWELLNKVAFDAALKALDDAKIAYELGSAELCRQRCVQQMAVLFDPAGNRHEVVWGFKSDFKRFASPQGVSSFVTGDYGLGHTVLPAPDFEATVAFARDVLGFETSDIYNFKPAGDAGPTVRIHFFHCANGRHHSLALAEFPVPSGCVHAMVEVENMPEVGRAMDRMQQGQVQLTATLGQHTNDRMTSFYMKTPSGFDLEYGYGGAILDWEQHIVHEFTAVSLWGHDFTVGRVAQTA